MKKLLLGMFLAILAIVCTTCASSGKVPSAEAVESAQPFIDRGIMFAMRGDYATAIEEFTEAINLAPTSSAYILRGRALLASVSHVSSVEENFSKIEIFTTDGNVTAEQRRILNRAIADYTQAIRLDPNNAISYQGRGDAYDSIRDFNKAITDFTRAIRLDPNNPIFYRDRAVAYTNKGDYDRAIADYTQAIRLEPNNAICYGNRGWAYLIKDDYDRALADYTQAIRLDPNNARYYGNRGWAYFEKDDYDRAIADSTQAIRLDPNNAEYYNERGGAYHNRGYAYDNVYNLNAYHTMDRNRAVADYERAIADYTQALRLDPNNTVIRQNLANVQSLLRGGW